MGKLGMYIARTVLGYTVLVTLVLLALGALLMFISQQDDIGTGTYTATQALLFVALSLPSYLFQLLPVAALIGACSASATSRAAANWSSCERRE